ncbi:hypothetical protein COW36_00540 [bacterium (Candidatus Blackallbacteria) CG17_big_fil_post_rev_8_21_14_2_50_48_46]|uniref:PD-(D/E)XK endonuclease-like domain-containing protein n=1 Tax=bacterium (Candidatus Blackallbacteria) CG17_big_fil_post_rev_8_21_14_2_50_48_46 TaxID=2014261 RepID=A0A2M7GB48_9BACT|nr:MAG: hypothetical protein COW64_10635 [bacterium (Candidatus Blackallbacteria) CG18_big_fil_WC_8_21_14_2_50_49_26]PIW19360.1 MAG: hypothetical protein COW36_00540 [bacterium (Candidatus Blackallbacteria) CG17_big_fil_post_rev_8_21_14_2_50_48_46]PIW49036.1 MAG: hypothetical protein COW20_07915 [bacterium (Candidatus Blackallbacteria) CG13_big_fil_rev_8_21_14_2_50_49_14]
MHPLISFHQLRDWRCCSQLYAYRYLFKIPDFQGSQEKERGKKLHELIEQDLNGFKISIPDVFAQVWQNYQNYIAPLKKNFQLHAEWDYFFSVQCSAQTWGITGRIDLWAALENTLLIVDWKSGKGPLSETDLWQMQWYAWSLDQMRLSLGLNKEQPIQTEWLYLETGQKESRIFSREELNRLQLEFCNHIAQTDPKEYDFIPNPHPWQQGNWCQRCTYQKLCPEGKYHDHERADFTV